MIKRDEFIESYWEPYLVTEREVVALLDYVSLRIENFGTCSERIIRILFESCELFESICKAKYELDSMNSTIKDYRKAIKEDELIDKSATVIAIKGFGRCEFTPFRGTEDDLSPSWWLSYTAVKHDRAHNFAKGTFDSALQATAALYYMNLVYVKQIGDYWHELGDLSAGGYDVPNDVSHLFEVQGFETRRQVSAFELYAANDEDFPSDLFSLPGSGT